MEQMDFSIEVSESAIKEFADYLYQRENARATVKKYMADIKKLFSFLADDKRINKKVLLQGQVFILGDNRPQASDSRTFGCIDLNDVKGKVIAVIRTRGL